MKKFRKRKSLDYYEEFYRLIKEVEAIERQDTMQEVDMMAGYYTCETLNNYRARKITKLQRDTMLEIIDSLQICRRDFLEHEDDINVCKTTKHFKEKPIDFLVGEVKKE